MARGEDPPGLEWAPSYLVSPAEKLMAEAVLPGPEGEGGGVRDRAFEEDEHGREHTARALLARRRGADIRWGGRQVGPA